MGTLPYIRAPAPPEMAMAAPMEGLPQPPPPPATDLTSISFRDQLWLNTYPLDRTLVFDYFAMSPFYDYTCSNEQLRCRGIHPLDMSHLSKMTGVEYVLHDAQEPNLFVFRKQRRDTPDKVTTLAAYYVLDGSIYQAPLSFNVIGSRVVRSLYHISKAFAQAASRLEKIGYDGDVDNSGVEKVSTDEGKKLNEKPVDMKEVMRIDQILGNVLRKLPPAPPPPPLPLPPGGVPEQPIETSQAEPASTDQTTLEKQGMGDQGPQLKKAKTEK